MTIGIETFSINRFQNKAFKPSEQDMIAIEMPAALIYNGISHAVMMVTPKDLDYFAIGFSLSEKIIETVNDIYGIDIKKTALGIEIHIEISSRRFAKLKEKRRNLTGRTGCGICGSEQIDQVCQLLPRLTNNAKIDLSDFRHAQSHLKKTQLVGDKTGCTHAAVWLDLTGNYIAGFEDIGRHVALDKLIGYRAKQQNQQGLILVSSRASYEMVQKTVVSGVEILFAVSAATSMAIKMAQQSNLTLAGFFRGDKAVLYSGLHRINE